MVAPSARLNSRLYRASPTIALMAALQTLLYPGAPHAAGEPASAPDLLGLERAFIKGQELLDRGDYKSAARIWGEAATSIPRTPEHLTNLRVLLEKIGFAYGRELARVPDAVLARGIIVVLDAHAQRFETAYPGEPPIVALDEARLTAQAIIATANEAKDAQRAAMPLKPVALPSPRPPAPEQRPPWKRLAIAGGVTVGASAGLLTLFVVSAAKAKVYEQFFENNTCDLENLNAVCAQIDRRGKMENIRAIVGVVTGPILLVAGASIMILAIRRKARPPQLAPMFSPRMAGITWIRNF